MGERKSMPGVSKKIWGETGRRWGEKESPAINPEHFTERCLPTNGKK